MYFFLLLGVFTSCKPISNVNYTIENASSSVFTIQLTYNRIDTTIIFRPHEEKKIAHFKNLEVRPYNFKKIKVKELNYKKFLLNLRDENSWKLTFQDKTLFDSSPLEYKIEIIDTDFI